MLILAMRSAVNDVNRVESSQPVKRVKSSRTGNSRHKPRRKCFSLHHV